MAEPEYTTHGVSPWKQYTSISFQAKFLRFNVKCSQFGNMYWFSENFFFKPLEKIQQGPDLSNRQIKVKLEEIPVNTRGLCPNQIVNIIGWFFNLIHSKKKCKFSLFKIELVPPILTFNSKMKNSILEQYDGIEEKYSDIHDIKQLILASKRNWRKI